MSQKNLAARGSFGVPLEASHYFQGENYIPTREQESCPKTTTNRSQGIQLLSNPSAGSRSNALSPINRIIQHQQPSQSPHQVYQPKKPCECGHERALDQLRLQNESLRKELVAYEQSFMDRVSIEVRERQLETARQFERKIEQLQQQLNRQVASSAQEDSVRQHLKTYEKYIDNLERSKENLQQEILKVKRQNERLSKLEQKVSQLQQEKENLNETLSQREEYFNQTITQINMETQHRGSNYYIEELEKTNLFLKNENKRLNSVLLERLRTGASR